LRLDKVARVNKILKIEKIQNQLWALDNKTQGGAK